MALLDEALNRLSLYEKAIKGEPYVHMYDNYPDDPFDIALNFTLKEEGGYVNDSADPGGQTKFGISKASYPTVDIPNLTLNDAKSIYRNDYWKPFEKVAEIHPKLAIVLFDTAVNMGVGTAVRLLQKAVHTKVDGVLGPATMEAISTYSEEVIPRLLHSRIMYYTSRPHWERFKNGWVTRVLKLAMEVA